MSCPKRSSLNTEGFLDFEWLRSHPNMHIAQTRISFECAPFFGCAPHPGHISQVRIVSGCAYYAPYCSSCVGVYRENVQEHIDRNSSFVRSPRPFLCIYLSYVTAVGSTYIRPPICCKAMRRPAVIVGYSPSRITAYSKGRTGRGKRYCNF